MPSINFIPMGDYGRINLGKFGNLTIRVSLHPKGMLSKRRLLNTEFIKNCFYILIPFLYQIASWKNDNDHFFFADE